MGIPPNAPPKPPAHRFLTFFGPISPPSSSNLRIGLTQMINEGAKKVTLLFASPGGSTDDGIALNTYIKALPIEIVMHAVGNVGSMGLPVFLAANVRLASKNSRFFFHNYVWGSQQAEQVNQDVLAERTMILDAALLWTREIVKATTKLTDADFEAMKLFEKPVLIEPGRALECGLISEIKEPAIPADSQPRVVI